MQWVKRISVCLGLAFVAAGMGTAKAAVIPLQNPGFNATRNVPGNPPLGVNDFTTGSGFGSAVPVSVAAGGGSAVSSPQSYTADTLPGWTNGGGVVGVTNADSSYYAAGGDPASGPYAYANAGGLIFEALSGTSFAPNTNYLLGVDVIRNNLSPLPDILLELRAGGPGGALVAGSGGPGTFVFVPPATATSSHATLEFTTGATVPAGDLTIVLGASGSGQANFDNVTLDASSVPEPAFLSVLGLGAFALLARRRAA